jgi:3-oxoacyl-[acyl-carrier protein] reductase
MKKNKKKILITGSSSGLGWEIAKHFYNNNYLVGINGRNIKKLKQIKKKYLDISINHGDLSNYRSSKNVIQNFIKENGSLDTLVCNVGNGDVKKIKEKKNINIWKKMFDLNFWSTINAIDNALPYLKKTKGRIICISSICGLENIEGAPISYSVAKSALNTFVKNYSFEVGKFGIKINAVVPGNLMFRGSTWSQKIKKDKKKTMEYINKNVPLAKFGKVSDIISMIEYLDSEKSSFVTGSLITIDGGQTKGF